MTGKRNIQPFQSPRARGASFTLGPGSWPHDRLPVSIPSGSGSGGHSSTTPAVSPMSTSFNPLGIGKRLAHAGITTGIATREEFQSPRHRGAAGTPPQRRPFLAAVTFQSPRDRGPAGTLSELFTQDLEDTFQSPRDRGPAGTPIDHPGGVIPMSFNPLGIGEPLARVMERTTQLPSSCFNPLGIGERRAPSGTTPASGPTPGFNPLGIGERMAQFTKTYGRIDRIVFQSPRDRGATGTPRRDHHLVDERGVSIPSGSGSGWLARLQRWSARNGNVSIPSGSGSGCHPATTTWYTRS